MALYVYFRAAASADAAVVAALARQCALVRDGHGIEPRLLRRPDLRDGARTWMEVYEPLEPSQCRRLLEALPELASRSGLQALVDGARHVERFEAFVAPESDAGRWPGP